MVAETRDLAKKLREYGKRHFGDQAELQYAVDVEDEKMVRESAAALAALEARAVAAEAKAEQLDAALTKETERAVNAENALLQRRLAAESSVSSLTNALQPFVESAADCFTAIWGDAPDDYYTSISVSLSELRAARAALGSTGTAERVTHGRHCPCSACAREDWTNPELAHCGMHGPDCPAVYAPVGSTGTA